MTPDAFKLKNNRANNDPLFIIVAFIMKTLGHSSHCDRVWAGAVLFQLYKGCYVIEAMSNLSQGPPPPGTVSLVEPKEVICDTVSGHKRLRISLYPVMLVVTVPQQRAKHCCEHVAITHFLSSRCPGIMSGKSFKTGGTDIFSLSINALFGLQQLVSRASVESPVLSTRRGWRNVENHCTPAEDGHATSHWWRVTNATSHQQRVAILGDPYSH